MHTEWVFFFLEDRNLLPAIPVGKKKTHSIFVLDTVGHWDWPSTLGSSLTLESCGLLPPGTLTANESYWDLDCVLSALSILCPIIQKTEFGVSPGTWRSHSHFLSLRNQVGRLFTNKVAQKLELTKEEARMYLGSHHWATNGQWFNLTSVNVWGSMTPPGSWIGESLISPRQSGPKQWAKSTVGKTECNPLY